MRRVRLGIIAIGLASTAAAQMEHVARYEARVYEDATGGRLSYRLFRPESYDASRRYPLVVYLHGAGGRGADNLKQLTGGNAWATHLFSSPEVQQRHPSFVLVPQINPRAVSDGWGGFVGRPPAGTEFLSEPAEEPIDRLIGLIDSLGAEFSLDSQRIYVTGQSMGGYGTWAVITRYPDRFAAAVPICGGGDPSAAARIGIPVWAFHGADDKTVPVEQSRSMVNALKAAGAKPRYTEYPGVGHNSYEKTFSDPELVEWLFSHRAPI